MLIAAAVLLAGSAKAQPAPAAPPPIRAAALKPSGVRYRAVVPDTLDLAERARLAVHGLTSFLDERANYAPYGHTFYDANPPYLGDLAGGPPNWGKICESLLFARLMCGSEENLDIEAKTLRGMLSPPPVLPGNQYLYSHDYMTVNPVAPTPISRAMLALMVLDQTAPDAAMKRWIDGMADDQVRTAKPQGDGLYYNDEPPITAESRTGKQNFGFQVYTNGCAMRPLARWAGLHGNGRYLLTARKLAAFAMQDRFWTGEGEPKAVVASDRAHFDGHIHSYTQCMMGLLCYAEAAHDTRVKEFVRSGYEYLRNFGIARIGLFGEACATGDMTYLALKLSDTGAGDYWDDADQYVRNELAELQITDAAKLRRVTDRFPRGRGIYDETKGPTDPLRESAERVPERVVGTFFSDSTHPALIPRNSIMETICCTGNCTPALYFAWDSIVRCDGGAARVNLLLNRASEWLDVDSFLPYEGKVVVHNKRAKSIAIRMPRWVDRSAVRCSVDGRAAKPIWAGQYAVFAAVSPRSCITVKFPVVETTEIYRLKWRQPDFFFECTDPGTQWPASELPTRYVCKFRGNTLVDISPRPGGIGYPLYERDGMKGTTAPMKSVERYVPPRLARW
jgi:hypothetical protein